MNKKFKIGDLIQHKVFKKFILKVLALNYSHCSESNDNYVLKDIKNQETFNSSTSFIESNYLRLTKLGIILYK